MKMLERLEDLQRDLDRGRLPMHGICHFALDHNDHDYLSDRTELRRLFRQWPKFSGDINFPVSGDYNSACRNGSLWLTYTVYGNARRDLLAFLIRELRQGKPVSGLSPVLENERQLFEAYLCSQHGFAPEDIRAQRQGETYIGAALALAWSCWLVRGGVK